MERIANPSSVIRRVGSNPTTSAAPDMLQGGAGGCKPPAKAWGVRFSHQALACGAMAAQSAVNRWVVGSNPTTPAKPR